MPARPKMRRLFADIAAKGGWEWIFEQIASGVTIKALADQLGTSRPHLSRYLNRPERIGKLRQAQAEAAHAIMEEAHALVDSAPVTRDDVAKAKLQYEVRRDRAEILNRAEFGRSGSPTGENLGELLVGALAAVAKRQQQALPAPVPVKTEPMPAEIVPEPPGS